eukprot:46987-Lingulodinium_polyedra.AAC.1
MSGSSPAAPISTSPAFAEEVPVDLTDHPLRDRTVHVDGVDAQLLLAFDPGMSSTFGQAWSNVP